ncbi:hypothetical protein DM01DRAFT_1339070 [Hesseltinella vesiculosa]|uniref:Uncharacterized protein n=1 Tax=Hesseltinella vesiculosa TaxID=101127 RepID=A0A1X2G960_9FUNG|nr:hypothetical protein DM01DRAFT_1339070 [Hesseltinella vesiculosa]
MINTRGLAGCRILGLDMNSSNRKRSRQILDESAFDVVHEGDKSHPIAMGKNVIKRDPIAYQTYPDTPPLENERELQDALSSQTSSQASQSSAKSAENTVFVLSPNGIEEFLQAILSKEPGPNTEPLSLTIEDTYTLLKKWVPNGQHTIKPVTLGRILTSLGFPVDYRLKSSRQRTVHVLIDEYIEHEVKRIFNLDVFREATRDSEAKFIGYTRLSRSNATQSKREELLQKQVDILKNVLLCQLVYVTMRCNASQDIEARDRSKTDRNTARLRHMTGDAQDMLGFLNTCHKPVHLVLLDYGGLTRSSAVAEQFIR